MSTIDSTNIIVGNSSTQSQNLKILSNSDGTFTIGRADGSQTLMTIDGSGKVALPVVPTFISTPVITTAQSMVRLNTANGYGSTNTMIRRFTNVVTNQGSDITYADSATLGASFTINANGVYAISYSDAFTTATWLGVSINSSLLTTAIPSITITDILVISNSIAAAQSGCAAISAYLPSGTVVRPHTSGGVTQGTMQFFTITRVS